MGPINKWKPSKYGMAILREGRKSEKRDIKSEGKVFSTQEH